MATALQFNSGERPHTRGERGLFQQLVERDAMARVGLPMLMMQSEMVESMGGNTPEEAELPLAIGALREMDPKMPASSSLRDFSQ